MPQNFLVGLDVGSSTVKAAIAEVKGNKLALLKILKMPSRGMRKGVVDDVVEVTGAVNQVLSEVKKDYHNAHKNIFLNTGSAQIRVQQSRGIVAVSRADYEICHDDMDRVIKASEAVKLPPNRMILHTITREFVVDGVGEIKDPLGMIGNRLEANVLLVEAFSPAIKNLSKCVETNGGDISGLIYGPLASAKSVLSKNQMSLGTVVVDIGFGTTGMAVYEDGKLVHSAIFPFGAGNVTNDLAIGLKTSIETAEAIKFSFGAAVAKDMPAREMIDLKKIDPRAKGMTARRFVAEIVEIRLAEIFEHVNNELQKIEREGKLPGGVVLVGGGAKMPGLPDLVKQRMRLPAQVGIPDVSNMEVVSGELALQIEDPEFACALGLLMWGGEKQARLEKGFSFKMPMQGAVRKVINYFVP
ncbi:MAG: cell division protein FtsA [Patescibacteria group bacterium]